MEASVMAVRRFNLSYKGKESQVFRGSTDASVFEDFIKQLLQHCNRRPEPKSVLVD